MHHTASIEGLGTGSVNSRLFIVYAALLSALAGPGSVFASTTVQISSVTATQAVMQVNTTNLQNACTYEVSESATYFPLVHDLDPALFVNSNIDLPNNSGIRGHRVFVVGKRRAELAQDGKKRYSRALQSNTAHYYRVTCGQDIVTGLFSTVDPPLGHSYPELPAFDPAAFGNLSDPTIDWLDRSQTYIDPLTGIQLRRVTGPGEAGSIVPNVGFDIALDLNGGWSNPTAALGKQPGVSATTSSQSAPLFLSWNEIHDFQLTWGGANFNPLQGSIDDLLLRLSGTGGATLSACISIDSGQTCAGTSVPVNLPGGPGTASPVPSNFPSPMFAGWGRAFSDWDIANKGAQNGGNANAGSRIFTAPVSSFNIDWAAGVKIKIAGSGCNGNDVCTIASIQNSGQLTTVETISFQVANQPWQVYAAGIRLSLASSGMASIGGASFDYAESYQTLMSDSTDQLYCSSMTVSDIYKDKNGNLLGSPLTGRLCSFPHGLYLLVDGTGEFRLLSNYFMNSHSPSPGSPVNVSTTGAFSPTDAKTIYGTINYQNGLFRGTYTGDYTPYKIGGTSGYVRNTIADDGITWTNIMPAGSAVDVAVEFPQYPGTSSYYMPSLFTAPVFEGLLGGYGEFFVLAGSGTDRICSVVRYNLATQAIQQVLTSWTTWPLRWGGCHFAPNGGGTYQLGAFNPIQNKSSNAPLGGPFQLKLTQVMKGGIWQNNTAMTDSNIALASNSTPVVVSTVSSSTDLGHEGPNNHGFIDGEPLYIFGATSNAVINTSASGYYYAKASWSDTTLALPIGAGDSSFSVADASRITAMAIFKIDSELIRCTGGSGNTFTGCTRGSEGTAAAPHLSGAQAHQANSFALYQDAALTTPLSGSGTYQDNRSTYVMDVDVCPPLQDTRWTSNMIYDSTGAVGRRCNTIRVAGEPVSNYAYWTPFQIGNGLANVTVNNGVSTVKLSSAFTAWQTGQQITITGANLSSLNGTFPIQSIVDSTTILVSTPGASSGVHTESTLVVSHPTEHYAFPFKGDPTNLNTSSLQDLQEGDFLNDLEGIAYSEQLVVVKKQKNSDTDIVLTVLRFWGDTIGCDLHARFSGTMVHKDGWSPVMFPSYGCVAPLAYADITDTTWRIGDSRIVGTHYDIAPGSSPGLFNYVSASGYTPVLNAPFNQIVTSAPQTGVVQEFPLFAGSNAALTYGTVQSYPAIRQITAPPSERVWKADFHALNGAYGAGQDSPVGLISGMNLSLLPGTSSVYKVVGMPSGLDRKRLPVTGFSGYHYLADMSGPGSLITDANRFRICVADFAGECRPGSNAQDVFANLPGADTNANGYCYTNSYEYNVPCIFSANSLAGWAVQEQVSPPDTNATKGRKLSMGFVNPGRHFSFANWVPTPDGQWGFISPPWVNGIRNDIFAMKLPPWPAPDNVSRTNFVSLAVPVTPLPGALTARAVFGYAENGPPQNFYCTSRQETCTTSGNPFAWLSDTQQLKQCRAGCTINIPVIPGRVVYYRIDWMDGAGRVLESSPVNATAATP